MLHLRTWEGIPTFAAQLIRIIFQRVFQPALRPRYFNLSSGGARSSVGARTQRRLINFLCRSSCSSALLTSERRATTSSGVKSALALLSTAYSDEPVSIFPSERSRPVTHVPAQCGSSPCRCISAFLSLIMRVPCSPCIQVHSSGVQSPSRSTESGACSRAQSRRRARALTSLANRGTAFRSFVTRLPSKMERTFDRLRGRRRRSLKFRAHAGTATPFFRMRTHHAGDTPCEIPPPLPTRTRVHGPRSTSRVSASRRCAAAGIRRPETNSIPRRPVCALLASSDRRGRLIKDTCGFLVGISADMNINHRGK